MTCKWAKLEMGSHPAIREINHPIVGKTAKNFMTMTEVFPTADVAIRQRTKENRWTGEY